MAELHITKQAAAQRQVDAAIRILFSGEDGLAIHTIVSAAHNVLADIDNKSEKTALRMYSDVLADLQNKYPGIPVPYEVANFKWWVQERNRSGANFLKHADRDSGKALDPSTLTTDDMLLEACVMYCNLGLEPTHEMKVFGRWHLAVYPNLESDRIVTKSGDVSDLARDEQLGFGLFLLESMGGR